MWQHIPFTAILMLEEMWASDTQLLFNMLILEKRWKGVRRASVGIFLFYACVVNDSISQFELCWAEKKKECLRNHLEMFPISCYRHSQPIIHWTFYKAFPTRQNRLQNTLQNSLAFRYKLAIHTKTHSIFGNIFNFSYQSHVAICHIQCLKSTDVNI